MINPKDIIGKIGLSSVPTSELPVEDPLDRARRVWRKGRHESMGGPTFFTQYGDDENNRICGYPPSGGAKDPIAHDMGLDDQE